jgi:hypothetical protein
MNDQEKAILDAIRGAQAEGLKDYVIKAWALWGTPDISLILTLPVALSPTLSPEVIFERAQGTARAEIVRAGYSEAEAHSATLTFEAAASA